MFCFLCHILTAYHISFFIFFFNDPATPEIYTLSLHDALPISIWAPPCGRSSGRPRGRGGSPAPGVPSGRDQATALDRKSTRLNSSHPSISYAVFCLKKKNINKTLREQLSKTHIHQHSIVLLDI